LVETVHRVFEEGPLAGRTAAIDGFPLVGTAIEERLSQLETGQSIPWSWYLDPDVLALEEKHVFRPAWHYVGHVGQVDEPGRFFTCRLLGTDVVVTRGTDDRIRALINVCRHRGARVVREPCGKRKTFQCHYHAWTYGLDGALRAAPRSDREPGFDREEFPLHAVAIEQWGPFLFMNLDEDPKPLHEALGTLPARLAEVGIDLERMRFHHRAEYHLECNWKVAIENFLECYHCAIAHPDFSALLDVDQDAYKTVDLTDRFTTQRAPVRDPSRSRREGWELSDGQYHVLWPSMKINVHPGHPNLSIGPVLPQGVGRSFGYLDYFFGDDVTEEWIEELITFDDQVGREDVELIESVQAGLASGSARSGRIFLVSEEGIAGFQRYLLHRFRDAASAAE
jgi:phenylpropionate dioxygenase-like ring-hydroxylating dioxygenase large terminal subunit